VYSTQYPGETWNALACGDYAGDSLADGFGLCTGTSMSAPQVTGLVGLLRSVNPLAPTGSPSPVAGSGIRKLLASTTDRAIAGLGWNMELGYGLPNAPRAVRGMLGNVRGWTARNRATPLFSLYSPGYADYAVTSSPQAAVSLMAEEPQAYQTTEGSSFIEGSLVPGFPLFASEHGAAIDAPRAAMYVLTTQNSPRPNYPPLIPLYWLDLVEYQTPGCVPRALDGCMTVDRENLLVTTIADVESLVGQGYAFKGRQGYIYAPCTPEPACIPPGATKFYRKCTSGGGDCAMFGEGQRIAFESAGYTVSFPSGSSALLGYAYPAGDADSDGLPDALERVIGTNINDEDSDDDDIDDAVEYPVAGVPDSDPCAGPNITCAFPAELIFADGFE